MAPEEEDLTKCPVVRSCYWKDSWQRMNSMRLTGQLCDVTLVTDCNTNFKAHSLVLAAGSDLFYTHFVQQSNQHAIHVSEISPEALRVTLDFIYGITPTDQRGFMLLLEGAQKIGIPGAMRFCERKLLQMSGIGNAPAKTCPLKDTDLIKRMLSKRPPESASSYEISSPASAAKTPFSMHEKAFITDLTAKFIDEVLSRHLGNHSAKTSSPSVADGKPGSVGSSDASFSWMPETTVSDSWSSSEGLAFSEPALSEPALSEPALSEPALAPPPSNIEPSESFALTSDMCSDPGGMPMDIHHSLIPEMTLNDLTRAPECPHLKKLAANSGLVVCDEIMEGDPAEVRDMDVYKEMLPKKRKLIADIHQSTEEDSVESTLMSDDQETEDRAESREEKTVKTLCSARAEDWSLSKCVPINIAPIDDAYISGVTQEKTPNQLQNKSKGKQHPCNDCSEVFATQAQSRAHTLKCHGKGKLFTCSDCDFKSPRKKDVQAHLLSKHKKAPPGLRIFKCEQCDYMCMDKNRYNEHRNCHSKDTQFKCCKCEKAYTTRRGLHTHMQYHSEERPHKCTECDASFKVRDKLRDHIRLIHTHKGEKPYKCSYCSHASALRGNCNQHIRKTHPGMPVLVMDTRKKDISKSENVYSSIATLPPDLQSP